MQNYLLDNTDIVCYSFVRKNEIDTHFHYSSVKYRWEISWITRLYNNDKKKLFYRVDLYKKEEDKLGVEALCHTISVYAWMILFLLELIWNWIELQKTMKWHQFDFPIFFPIFVAILPFSCYTDPQKSTRLKYFCNIHSIQINIASMNLNITREFSILSRYVQTII